MRNRSHFQKGSGVYTCCLCKKSTRSTGRGDNENARLCADCFDLASIDNVLSDDEKYGKTFVQYAPDAKAILARRLDLVDKFPDLAEAVGAKPKFQPIRVIAILGSVEAGDLQAFEAETQGPAERGTVDVRRIGTVAEFVVPERDVYRSVEDAGREIVDRLNAFLAKHRAVEASAIRAVNKAAVELGIALDRI